MNKKNMIKGKEKINYLRYFLLLILTWLICLLWAFIVYYDYGVEFFLIVAKTYSIVGCIVLLYLGLYKYWVLEKWQ